MRCASLRALLLALLVLGTTAAGCGGQTTGDISETEVDNSKDAGKPPTGKDAGGPSPEAGPIGLPDGGVDGGKKPKPPVSHDGGPDASPQDAGNDVHDAFAEFNDPGCPDAGLPVNDFECDLNAKFNPCGDGMGCYPFVVYPSDPCGQETYGSQCVAVGTGAQGDDCDQGCQAGHVCVITGEGTQCVQMCDASLPNPCEDGLVCAPVDIPGVGGCI